MKVMTMKQAYDRLPEKDKLLLMNEVFCILEKSYLSTNWHVEEIKRIIEKNGIKLPI